MNPKELPTEHLITFWQTSHNLPELRKQIEAELKSRIPGNTNFSREFIFEISKLQRHAVGINFIPGSLSFLRFGQNITISVDESMNEELLRNYYEKKNTYGFIRAKILVRNELNDEQVKLLLEEGFDTHDIFETLHL